MMRLYTISVGDGLMTAVVMADTPEEATELVLTQLRDNGYGDRYTINTRPTINPRISWTTSPTTEVP